LENPSDYRVGSPFAPNPPAATAPNPPAATAPDPPAADAVTAAANGTPIADSSVEGPAATRAAQDARQAAAREPETLGQGVWTETAAAAAYAAVIMLAFASACLLLFPAGGIAVAALGAVLSLLGLSSRRVRLSIATLVLHGVLFFVCYLRAI